MDARAKADRGLPVTFRLIRWGVALAIVFVSSVPTAFSQGAGCVKAVCFDGSVHPCGFDCSTLVKGSGEGGGSGGYDAGADPMMDNFTATMQTFFTTMDFVDSLLAEEKAKQARREKERERQRQAEQARLKEIDRLRQVANQKLMGSLKLGGGTKLQMKSLDGSSSGGLRLKGIEDQPDSDVDLRPKGTAFFGLGGEGPPTAPAGGSDVVDLRNFRRAAFLAEAARTASPEDRPFFIGEALRAADGDTSVVADVPPDAVVVDNEEKFIDFQEANKRFAAAQESVRAAKERLSLAERRVFVIKEDFVAPRWIWSWRWPMEPIPLRSPRNAVSSRTFVRRSHSAGKSSRLRAERKRSRPPFSDGWAGDECKTWWHSAAAVGSRRRGRVCRSWKESKEGARSMFHCRRFPVG